MEPEKSSILEQINPSILNTVTNKLTALQLTDGCSIGCMDCGFESKKKIKQYISYKSLQKFFLEYKNCLQNINPKRFTLYFASEPFDYNFDNKNILDIADLLQSEIGIKAHLSTAIPKRSEEKIFDLLMKRMNPEEYWHNNEWIYKVSITKSNHKRIEKYVEKKFPQINTQLRVPLISDYELNTILKTLNIHNSNQISKTPFMRYPTYSEEGFLFQLDDERFILSPKPVDYLDIIASLIIKEKYCYDTFSHDPDLSKRLKLGQKNIYELADEGILGEDGYVITPEEVFYAEAIRPSIEYPLGFIKKSVYKSMN